MGWKNSIFLLPKAAFLCFLKLKKICNIMKFNKRSPGIKLPKSVDEKNLPNTLTPNLISWAAKHGKLGLLKKLRKAGCPFDNYATTYAAIGNHVSCLKYLRKIGAPWSADLYYYAAANDSLECIEYADKSGCPKDRDDLCDIAMIWGKLRSLTYMVEHNFKYSAEDLMESAAYKGHLYCLQYMHSLGNKLFKSLYSYAAGGNNKNIIEYLISEGVKKCKYACHNAAKKGNYDCLILLHEHDFPWDESVPEEAVKKGHHECLQFLIDNDCPCYPEALINIAATNEKSHSLRILHKKGFPVDEKTYQTAASASSIRCLKYLDKINCPKDESAYFFVSSLKVVKHLHEKSECPWNEHAFITPIREKILTIIKYLCKNDCPQTTMVSDEATIFPIALKYLHEHGCPMDDAICERAVENRNLASLRYLCEVRMELDEGAMHIAVMNNDLDIVKFLKENGCPCPKEYEEYGESERNDCLKYLYNFEQSKHRLYNEISPDASDISSNESD
jgi:hypothetical protein